ncbi:MAG: DIP1984 family protein [Oscillospiraceae bacterium]|nr:DIP1984 family protein [Oscillospiraceae bacterium]
MKLATALSERSDLQRRLTELSTRLNQNAKVQEGDSPAEEPEALLRETDGVLLRLEELIARINLTNSRTVSEGESLTEKLAKRDCLGKRITLMRSFLDAASARVDRYSRTEIKVHSSVSVSALQQELDRLSKSLRELDEHIQELNWTTELQ